MCIRDRIYSDDDGKTWNGPIPIADTTKGNRGTLNVARDNYSGSDTEGYLLFSWYDARRDPENQEVDTFIAVFDPSVLPTPSHKNVSKSVDKSIESATKSISKLTKEEKAEQFKQKRIDRLRAKYERKLKGCLLYTSPSPRDRS